MIPTKPRDNRRMKTIKLSKNLERKYKEVKCRECTVVVTPMDFAKILGKFTKVKIQYENSSKTKPKQTNAGSTNSRSKAKENGMVKVYRNVYNPNPATKLSLQKKSKPSTPQTPASNVLKENNRLKKPEKLMNIEHGNKLYAKTKVKYFGVVFDKPKTKQTDSSNKISLQELVSDIDTNILPTEDWIIDYFPKNGEPKEDKIYDRIAAELEDLMYNEKTKNKVEGKNDEFPSILDILNENTKDDATKSNPVDSVNLESSDVEAMLLGNSNTPATITMEVDNTDTTTTTETKVISTNKSENSTTKEASAIDDNPESPSILEEPPQKDLTTTELLKVSNKDETAKASQIDENDNNNTNNKNSMSRTGVTQIVFKKSVNGKCHKSVTCPKNLKYSVSLLGKSVELLGAPEHISSLEDLQVLLQIVEDSDLTNLYVLH